MLSEYVGISLAIKLPSMQEVSAHETLHDSPSFPSQNATFYEVSFNKMPYEIQSIHKFPNCMKWYDQVSSHEILLK